MSNKGVTASTVDHLVIDTGELFYGYTDPGNPGTSFGATKGGAKWDVKRSYSDSRPDGALGPVKGYRRRKEVVATLVTNLWELTAANIAKFIAGASEIAGEVTGGEVSDGDYIDKLALIGQTMDGRDVIIILENALADGNLAIDFKDQDEHPIPVTFTAHFLPTALTVEPWSVYVEPAGS
jgi:hypothetical protein